MFERDPYEFRALANALLHHFGFSDLPLRRAPNAEWAQQLRQPLPDQAVAIYYVVRPPEGQEILPRALCFAVGSYSVAAVVRRVKEVEELEADDRSAASFEEVGQEEGHFPVSGELADTGLPGRFVGSNEMLLRAQDANEMWRAICDRAGIKSEAVGKWAVIDRNIDRGFAVRHVLKYGAPGNSANIDGLRRSIGNDKAEVWEIEALGTPWSLRIAAINYRSLAAIQWIKR